MTAAEPPPADRSRARVAWRQALLPFALLLVLGNLWGFAFSLAKTAATAGVPPLAYAFWQSLGAAWWSSSCAFGAGSRRDWRRGICATTP